MALTTRWVMGLGAVACLALLFAGCPNPNTYTTPRTAGAGKFTHSIAPEAWGFSVKDSAGASLSGTYPTLPTYTLRIGVADPVDIGLRIANISSLGADVKWNFLRSRTFDAAFDPGVQYFHLSVSASDTSNDATVRLTSSFSIEPVSTAGVEGMMAGGPSTWARDPNHGEPPAGLTGFS